ncbi:MAG: hypothetical protein KAY37_05220 [Phycisphaerae bacterium]|nr:hypothetical protein [Phycisphaerae bacterium]
MRTTAKVVAPLVLVSALLLSGCGAPTIDFSTIVTPSRAPELDAYDMFVGKWSWDAKLLNVEGEDANWSGTAQWEWTLNKRCLAGRMAAKSANAEFESEGIWSWHPKAKKYTWWMFNNWGYPQQGTAKYDEEAKLWRMPFKSVGLDGSYSYGVYTLQVMDPNTIEWTLTEWADMLHMFKKMEMTGTYTRR